MGTIKVTYQNVIPNVTDFLVNGIRVAVIGSSGGLEFLKTANLNIQEIEAVENLAIKFFKEQFNNKMKKDWIGNKVSYITTNGFANNRDYERETNDYYATEPKAVEMLLELEDFTKFQVWECACGEGHLSKAMENKGITVYSSDLINRDYGNQYDFLNIENVEWKGHIITNPPYKYAKEFIEKAISIIPNGCLVAMFLPIRYTEGKARKKLFQAYPPKTVYISSSRLKCAINGTFAQMKGSATSYAWFVWQKGFEGTTELKWFN